MQRIIFSRGRQRILEFLAEGMEFAQEAGGLMLSGAGEIVFQDTALVEAVMNHSAPLQVALSKDGETVLEQSFDVTFFLLEADKIAVLLA